MRKALLLVTLALGCGGQTVDSRFSGTWRGPATMMLGSQSVSYSSSLAISAMGDTVSIHGICFDGTGSLDIHGAGEKVTWAGSLPCDPVALTDCSSVVFTYSTGEATVYYDGTLGVTGSGYATGCSTRQNFSVSLTASK